MKKINSFITTNIEKIITVFIFLQPILDVLTAISIKKFNINLTIGSITRVIFLLFCIYYLVFLSKNYKKKNIIFLLLLGIYFTSFTIITLVYKDINILPYEIKNTLNTFYLPITLISFLEIFKEHKIKFKLKNIIITFSLYLLFIIIPAITNTSFLSYSHSKLGTVGWFLSANAVGNILSFLLPLVIWYLIKICKNTFIKIIIFITTLYVFINMGTKVPILSLIIIAITNIIYFLILNIKKKNYKIVSISIIAVIMTSIITIILIPKTTFYKNLEIHRKYLGIDNYTEILTNYDHINNFIFSERLTFLSNTHESFKNSHLPEKILGIGYIENYNTPKESTKTIEIDYLEIFYRQGIVGTILYFFVFVKVLIITFKRITNKFNLLNIEYATSIILILLLSLFSGHILVTPAVSIYISLLLVIIINGFKEIDNN